MAVSLSQQASDAAPMLFLKAENRSVAGWLESFANGADMTASADTRLMDIDGSCLLSCSLVLQLRILIESDYRRFEMASAGNGRKRRRYLIACSFVCINPQVSVLQQPHMFMMQHAGTGARLAC